MDYLLLYLILRLDTFSSIISATAVLTGLFFIAALLVFILNPKDVEIRKASKPLIKVFGIPFVIVVFFVVMAPNTQQAAVVYCLPKVVNNEQVQKMPDNLLKLANEWIDEQLDKTTDSTAEILEN